MVFKQVKGGFLCGVEAGKGWYKQINGVFGWCSSR